MATVIHLDTHVIAWLYAGQIPRLSARARAAIERDAIAISPMVELELEYLHEIGRLTVPSAVIVEDLERRLGLSVLETPFPLVVAEARRQSWTRDPFDRLIAAQAIVEGASLLTADEGIRAAVRAAVWE